MPHTHPYTGSVGCGGGSDGEGPCSWYSHFHLQCGRHFSVSLLRVRERGGIAEDCLHYQ